jgi:hypothetical protein
LKPFSCKFHFNNILQTTSRLIKLFILCYCHLFTMWNNKMITVRSLKSFVYKYIRNVTSIHGGEDSSRGAASIFRVKWVIQQPGLSLWASYWLAAPAIPLQSGPISMLFSPILFTSPWRWKRHGPPKLWCPITTQKTSTWTNRSYITNHKHNNGAKLWNYN